MPTGPSMFTALFGQDGLVQSRIFSFLDIPRCAHAEWCSATYIQEPRRDEDACVSPADALQQGGSSGWLAAVRMMQALVPLPREC